MGYTKQQIQCSFEKKTRKKKPEMWCQIISVTFQLNYEKVTDGKRFFCSNSDGKSVIQFLTSHLSVIFQVDFESILQTKVQCFLAEYLGRLLHRIEIFILGVM